MGPGLRNRHLRGKIARIARADTSSFSFGAWFAVVTVDPDLGLVRVELSGMIFIIKLLYRT
jgi:CO/xanthine dehydrogenase Mo-binding subunit